MIEFILWIIFVIGMFALKAIISYLRLLNGKWCDSCRKLSFKPISYIKHGTWLADCSQCGRSKQAYFGGKNESGSNNTYGGYWGDRDDSGAVESGGGDGGGDGGGGGE